MINLSKEDVNRLRFWYDLFCRFSGSTQQDIALMQRLQLSPAPVFYQHVKRGTTYERLGNASLQAPHSIWIQEGDPITIYAPTNYERDENGLLKMYARLPQEFDDGRFSRIGD